MPSDPLARSQRSLEVSAAAGQRQPPKTTEGQTEQVLRTIDLTDELKSVQGRTLRMRTLTVEPGGALAPHSHANRPAVRYLLE